MGKCDYVTIHNLPFKLFTLDYFARFRTSESSNSLKVLTLINQTKHKSFVNKMT